MGYEKITKAGLKLTIQRMAILEYLENTEIHPDADTVYQEIHKRFPNITISTVYNTLETFVKHNIINKVLTPEGKSRYDAKTESHHHLIDEENKKIYDIFDEELDKIIEEYLKNKKYSGYEIEKFKINFVGKKIN